MAPDTPAPVPRRSLIASEPFGALAASAVAAAIARGLRDGGAQHPDELALPGPAADADELRELLAQLGFDERMRRARALILAVAELAERTLAGSAAFELATRARQSGVPAYAITAHNRLDSFDARMLDLQLIIEGGSARELRAAARRLARSL